jgi:hypothetical protein
MKHPNVNLSSVDFTVLNRPQVIEAIDYGFKPKPVRTIRTAKPLISHKLSLFILTVLCFWLIGGHGVLYLPTETALIVFSFVLGPVIGSLWFLE